MNILQFLDISCGHEPWIDMDFLEKKLNEQGLKSRRQQIKEMEELTMSSADLLIARITVMLKKEEEKFKSLERVRDAELKDSEVWDFPDYIMKLAEHGRDIAESQGKIYAFDEIIKMHEQLKNPMSGIKK